MWLEDWCKYRHWLNVYGGVGERRVRIETSTTAVDLVRLPGMSSASLPSTIRRSYRRRLVIRWYLHECTTVRIVATTVSAKRVGSIGLSKVKERQSEDDSSVGSLLYIPCKS